MNRNFIVAICAIVVLFGCKKTTVDNTLVSFGNRVDKDVVLSIYRSMEDYGNNTNVVVRKVLKANEIGTIPASTFAGGQTYYMDWYTDDRYRTNWYSDEYPQSGAQVAFKPVVGNNTYYIDAYNAGQARQVFLSTDDVYSKWSAVNAYLYSASTGYISMWSNMSETEKYREVMVRKNFTADYYYRTSPGNTITEKLKFKVHRVDIAYIELMDSTGSSAGSMMTGMLPTATPPAYKSASKDTVMALLPYSDYYFMMVRN